MPPKPLPKSLRLPYEPRFNEDVDEMFYTVGAALRLADFARGHGGDQQLARDAAVWLERGEKFMQRYNLDPRDFAPRIKPRS